MPTISTSERAVAGIKIYLGGQIDATDIMTSTQFTTGQTYVELKGVTNIGAIKDEFAKVTVNRIDESRQKTMKGSKSATAMEIKFVTIYGDAGQAAIKAAHGNKANYALKIIDNEVAVGTGTVTPTVRYLAGIIECSDADMGGSDDAQGFTATFTPNSTLVKVDATIV